MGSPPAGGCSCVNIWVSSSLLSTPTMADPLSHLPPQFLLPFTGSGLKTSSQRTCMTFMVYLLYGFVPGVNVKYFFFISQNKALIECHLTCIQNVQAVQLIGLTRTGYLASG